MSLERVESVPKLPKRSPGAHKGDFGTVLAICGGRGMSGAAILVGSASLRSGAGLVRVASAGGVAPIIASFEPCYMTFPLPEDADGRIAFPEARADLGRLAAEADVLAVGPGLGQSDGLRAMIRWIVEEAGKPAVLDADALNNLVGQAEVLRAASHPVVITPHPGEFARLVGKSTGQVQTDREGLAAAMAGASDHLIVVLKGSGTVVTDGRRCFVNRTGNPGMATGGSGDVLTGVIAAMLGQRLAPFDAAVLGTHAHGLAGDIAREHSGEVALIAGDLVDALADAFEALAPLD